MSNIEGFCVKYRRSKRCVAKNRVSYPQGMVSYPQGNLFQISKLLAFFGEISKSRFMGQVSKNPRPPLFPLRHTQEDFFVCDVFDAVPKGDMVPMEHPVFTISQKPDLTIRKYVSNDGDKWMEITPSVKGLATVFDRDLLIYCISQLIAAMNDDRPIERTLRMRAHDFLIATNRMTNGNAYSALRETLERLAGTRITTNLLTGDIEQLDGFGLIDKFRIVRETRKGRMLEIEVTLSDWIFNAIQAAGVLTYSHDYFRLRSRLERRLYEIARRKCGVRSSWECGLEKLQNMTGSKSHKDEFKRMIEGVVKRDAQKQHMPDYRLFLEDCANGQGVKLVVRSKQSLREACGSDAPAKLDHSKIHLKGDTYEKARKAAPRWDIHFLEREWREWMKEAPKHPDAAFIGFCKKYYERKGNP